MKKAKIMLGALTVLTIVGSALTFKAQKTYNGNLCCTMVFGEICNASIYTTRDGTNWCYCTELAAPPDEPCTFYTKVRLDQ